MEEQQPLIGNGFKLLYTFQGGLDGAYPKDGLTYFNGEFYGTTTGGGGGSEWGTVFKVSQSGDEQVIYRFRAGNDGATPYAGLLALNGVLFGTTEYGGKSGAGTVFKVSTSGDERVVYSFKGGTDGEYPFGRLIDVNGTLYGTTSSGGGGLGWGTIFKVTTSGQEHVLYRFKAGNDGGTPYAGLTGLNGTLYGTTYYGGTAGAGTVFKASTSGAERVVYSFKGGADGQYPLARLIALSGELYGTTYQGGVYPGWGVVFKVSTTGIEHVLYRFRANKDGAHPQLAGLVELNGVLFGTTYQGGTGGGGTIFKVSIAGDEHVVYSFKVGADGIYPYDGLTELRGGLYGTTFEGGSNNVGTIFKLLP